LALATFALDAQAQRRGAVGTGVRGAVVGEFVGGDTGRKTGAEVGVVVGATRSAAERAEQRRAVDTETQARTEYATSAEYQNSKHSNFSDAPPTVLIATPPDGTAGKGGEVILLKEGKGIVAITYPSDWKQKKSDLHVAAVSADGHACAEMAALEGVKDREAGIEKIKQGLEKFLEDIKYDDLHKTERGALVITGTGKGKKSGVEVVFAAGTFDAGTGQIAGAAFVVDSNLEKHYKETIRQMCQSIRGAKELAK
jgi:hypothetical protein